MTVAVRKTIPIRSSHLRVAQILTAAIVVLAGVASGGGLLVPGLYRDPAGMVPVLRGQDLVTLVALPVMVVTLLAARHGSARGTLVWLGLLGYVCYTYTGAAFAYHFNNFFLIYVALFSLSVFALVALASGIDDAEIRGRFDNAAPRRPVVAFLGLIAFMLAAIELAQNIQFLTTGVIPEGITRSGGATYFVYVLDLGIIVPLAVLSAVWLWRRTAWGYILAGCILIKAATMGFALLSMNGFAVRAGQPGDGLTVVWVMIAGGGLGLSVWFLRHCKG
jgi:hypothetical protein